MAMELMLIPFLFEKRALIFDLGDIHSLSTRDILKISHIFITHTHMDHFVGFDRVLRLFLGREKNLYMYGPEGFIKNVEGKLAGYSWNLVGNFSNSFFICLRCFKYPVSLLNRSNDANTGSTGNKRDFRIGNDIDDCHAVSTCSRPNYSQNIVLFNKSCG